MLKKGCIGTIKAVALFLLLNVQVVYAYEITGRVIGVTDGDTIKILTADKRTFKIRLAEIDTPEKAQPFGQKAKQALSEAVYGKQITLDIETTDRYGRKVAQVFTNDNWINGALVLSGYAWVYRQYAKSNREKLLDFERQAKADKRGLWSLPEEQRVPPWEWRRSKN
jgi:endonuclease YncB( thermonuclease family)